MRHKTKGEVQHLDPGLTAATEQVAAATLEYPGGRRQGALAHLGRWGQVQVSQTQVQVQVSQVQVQVQVQVPLRTGHSGTAPPPPSLRFLRVPSMAPTTPRTFSGVPGSRASTWGPGAGAGAGAGE